MYSTIIDIGDTDSYELTIVIASCFLVNYVTADAKTNWAEGLPLTPLSSSTGLSVFAPSSRCCYGGVLSHDRT